MKNNFNSIAFVSALALHLIVFGVLVIGADLSLFKEKPKVQKVMIHATVIDQKVLTDLAHRKAELIRIEKQKKQQIAAEVLRKKREKEQVIAQKIAQEKRKVAEAIREKKRISDEKIARQKVLKEAKRVAEVKRVADVKRAAKLKEKKRIAEVKRLAKVKETQRLAKIKKAQKKARDRKERLRQAELDKAMEAEFADAFSEAQNTQQLSE